MSLLILFTLFILSAVRSKDNISYTELIIILTFTGLFMFLMIWETSCRYITNFIPFLILGAIGGMRQLSGVLSKVRKILDNKSAQSAVARIKLSLTSETARIFYCAVVFRIAIYLISVVIMAVFGDYQEPITWSDFLQAWTRWDSSHYLNIADNGYSGAIENGEHIFLVFYPLLPWLMKALAFIVHDCRTSGIIISTICFGIGCVYFKKLLSEEYSKRGVKESIILLSIFPFAFFFGSILTESLFFAIIAAFFYYLRKHEWNKVAVLGFLACMTKVQGILLAFSVLVELLYSEHAIILAKEKKFKEIGKKILVPGLKCVPMLGGFVVYLAINMVVEGDPFRFMYYQKNHWGNGLCPMWETLGYLFRNVANDWHTSIGMCMWLPELILFFVYLAAIIYAIKIRMRPMYITYFITFFILTYSSTWLISGGRYTLSALPLFMVGGQLIADRKKAKLLVYVGSFTMMLVYLIGYYQWKQIM